jgi:hypothetical protein
MDDPIDNDAARLIALLRVQLTAVHQQFIHVLALRRRGDAERASRIYEIDRADFPIVLKILNHVTRHHHPLRLASAPPTPGWPLAPLLRAEIAAENRMSAVLANPPTDAVGARVFAATLTPRSGYRKWLESELASVDGDPAKPPITSYSAADLLFSWLIRTIEQTMVHAFVHWHQGRHDAADISWAISGMAMMQATSLVNALADLDAVPAPFDVGLPEVAMRSDEAIHRDTRLAHELAEAAVESVRRIAESPLTPICAQVAGYSRALADWKPLRPHPAVASCAPSFRSFEATLRRFVWR